MTMRVRLYWLKSAALTQHLTVFSFHCTLRRKSFQLCSRCVWFHPCLYAVENCLSFSCLVSLSVSCIFSPSACKNSERPMAFASHPSLLLNGRLQAFVAGDLDPLKEWCAEPCFKSLESLIDVSAELIFFLPLRWFLFWPSLPASRCFHCCPCRKVEGHSSTHALSTPPPSRQTDTD